jgi:4'-phosphopantetheinyl transferase
MVLADSLWNSPTLNVTPGANEVHVWCVELDQPSSVIEALSGILSSDERTRASQFKYQHLRGRYIAGRATLRRLLGQALECDPARLEFKYNAHGKPELADRHGQRMHFNVSHSDHLALIDITPTSPIGVDLEQVRAVRYDLQIAHRFFTARESADLEALPEAERIAAFFSLWARKEAWLKAKGVGIAEFLNRVQVSFLPGEAARVLHVAEEPEEAKEWTLVELNPARGFIGALAIRRSDVKVQCWRFPG